jgi:hypothetical protein
VLEFQISQKLRALKDFGKLNVFKDRETTTIKNIEDPELECKLPGSAGLLFH